MTPETYRAMSERDRMEFALSRGMAAVEGRQIVFAEKPKKMLLKYKIRTFSRRATNAGLGKRIRQYRWMAGMTQQQLSEKTGISVLQIRRYEASRTILPLTLLRIANAFDVSPRTLLEFVGTSGDEPENFDEH